RWNFSWDAGLNYDIRRPIAIGGPDEVVERLVGEEIWLRGHIGGKVAVDGAVFASTSSSVPEASDGVELRRLRIYTTGDFRLVIPLSFKFEVDFIQGADVSQGKKGRVSVREAYLAYKDIPYLGDIYVGNVQTPVGLEAVASGRDITFMETGTPVEAF